MKNSAKSYFCGLVAAFLSVSHFNMADAKAQTIGFDESYVLAEDREEALKQLIPGTEDYYYYHALHYQNEGEFGKVDELLTPWIKRYNRTGRVREIQHRQALLRYDADPKATLAYLKGELNLKFDHTKEELNKKPNFPTSLDQKRITRATLLAEAFRRHKNLNGLEDPALDWLLRDEVALDSTRRRHLLQRLKLPDFPNLVPLIAEDLKAKESRGFGEFGIHSQLTKAQLEELLKLHPKLIEVGNYVNAYLSKLRPNADVDWTNDAAEKTAYIERQWEFVKQLPPVFHSLKAHVLYHMLDDQRQRGKYDRELFFRYIQMPRSASYMNVEYMKDADRRRYSADMHADFRAFTSWSPIGGDESLLRDFLMHFFVEEKDFSAYSKYLRESWVKPLFAETKIVNGLGDQEKWYSMISPTELKSLKDRIDIEFALTNQKRYSTADEVKLDLFVKNVDQLLVKVYEVNALNFYLLNGQEVNTDIVLDGLVANSEKTHEYDEIDLRRVRRTFEFPELKGKRGTWVVEFIGNGRSSRALVRKGKLQHLARPSAAGTSLRIFDGENKQVKGASVWLGNREYKADDKGRVTVPFSNSPGRAQMVLVDGGFASLAQFEHPAENYQFSAGIHVERETLLANQKAEVVIRPALALNGQPVNLGLLKNVRLNIVSTDVDGISSTAEATGFKLALDSDSTYTFRVPERLISIGFTLSAQVENISGARTDNLSASETFRLNQIETTDETLQFHLAKIDGSYVIEVLGKAAEPYADRAVTLEIKHFDFKDTARVTLQTDQQGHVHLGKLADIDFVRAQGSGISNAWHLPRDWHSRNASLHGIAGEILQVAYSGSAEKISRKNFALFEVRGGTYVEDAYQKLSLADGFVMAGPLAAGDYRLFIKDIDVSMTLRVTDGEKDGPFALSQHRHLELKNENALQIEKVDIGKDKIRIKVANANALARIHVAATRYLPEYPMAENLGDFPYLEPLVVSRGHSTSRYLSGRDIGDELRYILDRRHGKIYPGNMLTRPAILLNPWALRDTDTGIIDAAAGEEYKRSALDQKAGAGRGGRPASNRARKQQLGELSSLANLDFLAIGAPVFYNLVPDKDGFVTLDAKVLGDRQHLHVFAVDPANSAYSQVSVESRGTAVVDTSLKDGLDPAKRYAEQKNVTLLGKGDTLAVDDLSTAKVETYDDLGDVFTLYTTLSNNGTLAEFRFILEWPELEEEQKRAKYSKYSSHELNFFLSRRDPVFFAKVVKPYLANKKDKTFMDHYLIEADLKAYLEPWNYSRLNTVERILLAGRLGDGEPGATARHLSDLLDLVPADTTREDLEFATAILGKALDADKDEAVEKAVAVSAGVSSRGLMVDSLEAPMERARKPSAPGAPDPAAMPSPKREAKSLEKLSKDRNEMKKKVASVRQSRSRDYEEEESMEDAFGIEELGDVRLKLAEQRQFYRKLEATKEWAENNYYHLPIAQQNAGLVSVSAFWSDFAKHTAGAKDGDIFLSRHFIGARRNFTEMMFAMSVIGLPYKAGEHEAKGEGGKLAVKAASPAIIVHKEIKEAPISDEKVPLLISQNYFLAHDRHIVKNGETVDKFVSGEFLAGAVYGCQVVATNPTSGTQALELLVQIPRGAVPVSKSRKTKGQRLRLAPYHTQTFEYAFYFPKPSAEGKKNVGFPAHLARDEKIAAWAGAQEFDVVTKFSKTDTASWDYISQHGTAKEVVDRLNTANTSELNLERIAWRMKEVDFFRQVTGLLHGRHVYSHTLYSYGIYHNETSRARQYLLHSDGFLNQCGAYLVSTLVDIDPVARRTYQHLEYSPLVNARAHQLGRERKIVNPQLHNQYHQFLRVLRYMPQLDDENRLDLAYHLLLQDRIAEGMEQLEKADVAKLPGKIQHDYFLCYAAFYKEDPAEARRIASKYKSHPVDRWRERFVNVLAQVDEILGKPGKAQPTDNDATDDHPDDGSERSKAQDQLADTEPAIGVKVESGQVTVSHQNITEGTVNYYEMDLEFLFSSNPFVGSGGAERFSIIKPNLSAPVKFGGKKGSKGEKKFAIPDQFRSTNVLVEIVAAGQQAAQAYYANTLDVTLVENYGRLEVRDAKSDKPLPKAYIKVYARDRDGSVKFYKDGYTDLRGKFDYASLNTSQLGTAERFSILVMTEKNGSLVKEAAPPKQ